MNILVLTSVYPQPDDCSCDVTATVKYFCNKWNEMGHHVVVVHNNSRFPIVYYYIPRFIQSKMSSRFGHAFPCKQSRKDINYNENGIIVFRFPMKKIIPYQKFSKKTIKKQIEKIIDSLKQISFKPDVVLCHWSNPQVEIAKGLKKIYDAKYSIVFHGDCEKKQIDRYDLEKNIMIFDAVGCRSRDYAEHVQSALSLRRLPFVCCSGVPDDLAEKQMRLVDSIKGKKSRTFIFVGRLVDYKNVDTIIKALFQVYGIGEFDFHIIGEGAKKKELIDLSKELCIDEQVHFHGYMSRKEVFNYMRKCSVFVMVSEGEVFGMVYIEAMLAGCLVIASKGCGVDGIIVDGINGFTSEQGNIKILAERINEIDNLSNEEKNTIRRNAIQTAYEYRDSKVAERYLTDVYNWSDDIV